MDEKPKRRKKAAAANADPMEVMRRVLAENEFRFEENGGILQFRLWLENVEVRVLCWGSGGDTAKVVLQLPVRAAPKFRSAAGEFLHRLNFGAHRKFWELDYADGEIRLAAYTDTISAPLDGALFRAILNALARTADAVFPYLTSVLAGRLTPEFAADQAEAAISAAMRGSEKPDTGG